LPSPEESLPESPRIGVCGITSAGWSVGMDSRSSRRKADLPVDVEADIEQLRTDGKLNEVAKLVLDSYGAEVLGFLVTLLRDQADAWDAFGQASEDFWKGLPKFAGRSTMKTWFYTLARNAAFRLKRSPHHKRRAAMSELSAELAEVAQLVRTRTGLHLRTEVKAEVAAIRDELNEVDRAILVLRVDRDMDWLDVARVMSHECATATELTRVAARLRQRFQLVKKTIRDRARERGLMSV
jgi:RNA polymerase sigma-70 factor, ECF subfamily